MAATKSAGTKVAAGAAAAGSKPPSAWSANEITVYNYLIDALGFTPAQAAGVMGNFQTESNFNPKATNPSGARAGGLGIGQWTQGRYDNLTRYASSHGEAANGLPAQLGYLSQELKGPYARAYTAVKGDSTPQQAALDFSRLFEVNDVRYTDIRATRAGVLYGQLTAAGDTSGPLAGGGNVPTSPSSPSSPGTTTGTTGTTSGASPILGIPNPLNVVTGIPGDIVNGAEAVGKLLLPFLVNAACVIVGLILVVMSVKILADASSEGGPGAAQGGKPTEAATAEKIAGKAALA